MFSPDGPVGGSIATRNPRRRPRISSDDSIASRPTTKRRKRSLLAPDTFEPPTTHRRDVTAAKVNGHAAVNGHASERRKQRDVSIDATSLAIRSRGSKRAEREKRSGTTAEGVVQTKNDNYIVTQDPNIPESLQDILGTGKSFPPAWVNHTDVLPEPWQSGIASNLGHAVVTTHTQAIVWQYRQTTSALAISKPLAFKLPVQPIKSPSHLHPLPLGLLVHDASAGEIALLLVVPLSGQIIYWESVKRAANIDQIRQKQQGLQGTISGLLSGEAITRITEAEPDGFVLTTSNGRIVHLTVRDPHGRPLITSQYLRSNNAASGSLFGSITSVFSAAGWRKEIAAVRAGPLHGKSYRSCIVATVQGSFQMWELAPHSSKTLLFESDAKDEIFKSVQKSSNRNFTDDFKNDFTIIDFAIFPASNETRVERDAHRLLVLTFIKQGRIGTYNLVDLRIREGSVQVDVVHPVTCYSEGHHEEGQWNTFKAQLLLPKPAQTAFIAFDTSIVLVSLAQIEESPSSQLQIESHTLPDAFQDTLYLRKDLEFHVIGCSAEETEQSLDRASCVFLIHGFGLAQVTTMTGKGSHSFSDRSVVTVKSKVEQAIFYGSMKHNLLDFNPGRSQFRIEVEELEAALLTINESIMKSTSDYIPLISLSTDYLLQLRAHALADLINYAKPWSINPLVRWELLWSAEKMAAAQAIWKSYNAGLSAETPNRALLLPELLDMLHQRYKVENQPERGETDIVRHYLIHDIWRIQLVVPWAQQAVDELKKEGYQAPAKLAQLISQADDIQLSAMEAAFSFRSDNFARYGFQDDLLLDGVYQGNYDALPEIWTSILEIATKVTLQADVSRETALSNADSPTPEDGGIDLELLKKLAEDNPRLVHVSFQVIDERCRWLLSRQDTKDKAEGELLRHASIQIRKDLIVKMVDLELPDEGVKLAEQYEDMQALVDVLDQSTSQALERLAEPGLSEGEGEELNYRLESNRHRIESYYTIYGAKWANALYSKTISNGAFADLLDEVGGFQEYLTRYLRSRPNHAKLSWINEVTAEKNYAIAADNLMASYKQETNLWSKRIELSMGKLALMAAEEKNQVDKGDVSAMLRRADRRLAIIDIQDMIYAYIQPALENALDESAKADIALNDFGRSTKKKPTLRNLLQQNLKVLIARETLDAEDLVDTITLLNKDNRLTGSNSVVHEQFFLALKILRLSRRGETDPTRYELHEKIVWRRCMIQDSWEALNHTDLKDDDTVTTETASTALFRTLKACFEDGYFDEAELVPPTALLTAGTSIKSLRTSSRYADSPENLLKGLAHDLKKENRDLEEALEKGRLEMWWKGVVEAAKASVRADADRAGEEVAQRAEDLRNLAVTMGVVAADGVDDYGGECFDEDSPVDRHGDVLMS